MRQADELDGDQWLASSALYHKISRREATVGVVGLGYVGLPTMVASAQAGFRVVGIDIDPRRVAWVNAGCSYVEDVANDVLVPLVEAGRISATTDYDAAGPLDVVVICVPTPVTKNKEPELGPLQDAIRTLGKHMHGEQLVVLQSTTFPGTTEEMVLPQLQQDGRRVGREFFLAFSPERLDPGNRQFSLRNIPKVVGGVTPRCGQMATAFLSSFVEKVIPVSSPKVAEMTKLLENIFRSVNIALVNELSELCHRMGVDIWEVIHAAATKPFGFLPFYPGIGVGGHCIPVDPFYLSWKAKEHDFYVNFIELAAKINDNRPYYAVSRIVDILGDNGRLVKGACLLLLGVSCKRDIGDSRNSPALRVAEVLAGRGAKITYSDRHVSRATIGGCTLESAELDEATLQQHDATVILVDHSYFDLESIVRLSKLVIDTVDATRLLGPRPTVIKL
jgi:UDP-N-acetyl-D-glucosamine dehydrogenase